MEKGYLPVLTWKDIQRVHEGIVPHDDVGYETETLRVWKTQHGWTEAVSVGERLREHKVFPSLQEYINFIDSGRSLRNFKVHNTHNKFSIEEPKMERTVLIISTVVGVLAVKTLDGLYELPKVVSEHVLDAIHIHKAEIKHLQQAEVEVYPIDVEARGNHILHGTYTSSPKQVGNYIFLSDHQLKDYLSADDIFTLREVGPWLKSARQDLNMKDFLEKRGWSFMVRKSDDTYPEIPANGVTWVNAENVINPKADGTFSREDGTVFTTVYEAALYGTDEYNDFLRSKKKYEEKLDEGVRAVAPLVEKGYTFQRDNFFYGYPNWNVYKGDKLRYEGFSSIHKAVEFVEKNDA